MNKGIKLLSLAIALGMLLSLFIGIAALAEDRVTILLQILVPSIKPAIIVVALFIFIGIWNDVLQQTVYITKQDMNTIALGLKRFTGSYGTDWRLAMASTCMSIVPGVLVYLVCQKYFVEGIVMTGMKN